MDNVKIARQLIRIAKEIVGSTVERFIHGFNYVDANEDFTFENVDMDPINGFGKWRVDIVRGLSALMITFTNFTEVEDGVIEGDVNCRYEFDEKFYQNSDWKPEIKDNIKHFLGTVDEVRKEIKNYIALFTSAVK